MSTTSKPKPPPTTLHPTSSIHPLTTLTGTHPLAIAAHTYIHLRSHLDTTHGPLTIGENCIISEKAFVGLSSAHDDEQQQQQQDEGVTLENFVVIEPKAVAEAARIGEGTVVDVGAKVGKGSVIGKYCKIGPLCTVAPYEVIPDHTVIYGYNQRRIDQSGMEDMRTKIVEQHVEVLKRAETAAKKK